MIHEITPIRPINWKPGYRRPLGDLTAGVSSVASAGISAGVSLATTGIALWMNSLQLSHDADTATTLIVNGLGQQLSNLDAAYFAEPASCANQRAALDAYDQAWQWLQSPAACGNPSYGSAGNRCISDRAPGGKTPWATYYRDPIANDARLAGQNCDTSQQVILPSLTTGAYTPTSITAGGASATGPTQTVTAPSVATATTPAATTPTISPTDLLLVAAAIGGVFLLR